MNKLKESKGLHMRSNESQSMVNVSDISRAVNFGARSGRERDGRMPNVVHACGKSTRCVCVCVPPRKAENSRPLRSALTFSLAELDRNQAVSTWMSSGRQQTDSLSGVLVMAGHTVGKVKRNSNVRSLKGSWHISCGLIGSTAFAFIHFDRDPCLGASIRSPAEDCYKDPVVYREFL